MAKGKAKKETEGDMTPMIDCVFLLLIFFIIAAKFITPEGHIQIYQPKDTGQSNSESVTEEELQDVRIFLRGGKDFDLDGKDSRDITVYLDKKHIGTFDFKYVDYGRPTT